MCGQNPSAAQARQPFVLVEKDRGAMRLSAVDPGAAELGLGIGMPLADARARCPELLVAQHDRQADEAFLLRAAAACEVFTPLVALDDRDGLILDITGCAHLFGGEARFPGLVRRRLLRLGLASRCCIAGTPDAAHCLARFGQVDCVESGQEEAPVCALPVAALEAGSQTTQALIRLGLKTIGDLATRESRELAARFGAPLVARLGRMLGYEDLRITPLRALPDCMAERHFPEPVAALETLLAALEPLAREIAGLLEARGRGGRAFEVVVFRADGAVRRLGIETALASRDPVSLMRLIRLRIEILGDPLDPGFGFDAIRLAVLVSEAAAARQHLLEPGSANRADEREGAALLDRLVTRFGRERVLGFIARESHDPARAGASAPITRTLSAQTRPAQAWPVPEAEGAPLRPLTLFDPPQHIEALAEVPDGPPLRFRWRHVLHEVARAEGPERIAPEWWLEGNHAPATRDYYRIEDGEGRRFWLFREGVYEDSTARPRWFMHGLFA